jgi:uncharacterized protein (DUF433 family)
VLRAPGGLFIAGTRITLYDVMDYLAADWPPHLVRQWLNLTEQQMTDVLQYIDVHRAELEAEYQQMLQQTEDIRQYWDKRNRERLAHTAAQPPPPGQEAARAKLQAWKAKLEQAC